MSQDIHTASNQAISNALSKVVVLEFTLSELQIMKEALYASDFESQKDLIGKISKVQGAILKRI
jgi:hypothetical protein